MADNEDMRRNWTEGAAGWVANEEIFDAIFTPVTAAILGAAALTPGSRVLDVGCGTGTLLLEASRAGAAATGVDISPVMVEAARRRVPEAAIVVADAQSVDLGALTPAGGFDVVVSRFGVMFFADPVAAFANLGGASAADGRLVFVCWRGHDENPMFSLGTEVLTAPMADPPTPAPADAPGPSAFADPERLTRLLTDAGWRGIGVEPLDFTCDYGTDGSDGVERRLAGILATTTGRLAREALLPELGADGWAALLDDVRAELRTHLVDGVVRFPGACWLVTATAPAPAP